MSSNLEINNPVGGLSEIDNLKQQFNSLVAELKGAENSKIKTTTNFINTPETGNNNNTNVHVNSLVNNPTSQYVGCYNDKTPTALSNSANSASQTFSYDSCMKYALSVGDKYFGLQNGMNGKSQCFTTNDLASAQKYGLASDYPISPTNWDDFLNAMKWGNITALWASKTDGSASKQMVVTRDGQLMVLDNNGNTLYSSGNPVKECVYAGYLNALNASYGVNCSSQGFSVSSGNVTDKTNSYIHNVLQLDGNHAIYTIPVSNSTFSDPAVGCPKTFSAAYTCGTTNKVISGIGEGSYAQLDCSDEVSKCNFFVILQDDGNICIYKGTPNNVTGGVWCAYTQGQQKGPNPNWAAKNGKYGVNYITNDQSLQIGEWIGSNDGSLLLLMQPDGNLALYTSSSLPKCQKDGTDGKLYGGSATNAVYSIDNIGNKDDLGKIGYIDYEGNLSEYPSSMSSVDANGNVTINNNSSCTKQVNPIDSIAWNSFKKNSYGMTPDTMCGLANELIEEDIIINSIKGRLSIVADQLIQKITDLKNQNTSLNGQIDLDRDALDKNIQAYQTISDKYSKFKKDGEKYKMNNILLDSDVTVTYENYNFILWLILAIVLLLILFYYMR
jgi:hypothetical protein